MEKIKERLVETNNLLSCFGICEYAMENHSINVIKGKAGLGKSISLGLFSSNNYKNVVKVQIMKSTNPRIFYSNILNLISDEKYDANIPLSLLIKRVANLFVNKQIDMLLLIDEITKFEHNFFEHLQDFWELAKVNTGIILAGGDYFESKFKKWNQKSENGMPEFYSRIDTWIELEKPKKNEIINIIRAYDINDRHFEASCFDVEDFRELVKKRINRYLQVNRKVSIIF